MRNAALVSLILAVSGLYASGADAVVFDYDGEMFFCTSTCDAIGAFGGQAGGSSNTINSIVLGSIDIPVQSDGFFSFTTADNVDFSFAIQTSTIPPAPPVIGPQPDCPPPNEPGQLCNLGTVNPLPISPALASVEGFGLVGQDGELVSGQLTFTFTAAPLSNNGFVFDFDLSDSSAEGTIFNGAVTFTRVSGVFSQAPPAISVSMPVPDPFPATAVGDVSEAVITVANAGDGAASVVLDTTTLLAPFSIASDTCALPLPPNGGACEVVAQFAPIAEGAATGTFSVLSNDPDASVIDITLVGNAVAPEIEVEPNPLEFPNVSVSEMFVQTVTVANTGSANLIIPAFGVSSPTAPFEIVTDACSGAVISPFSSCDIELSFAPATPLLFDSSFDIQSNDPNEPVVTVGISGVGVDADIDVSPIALIFPSILAGQSSARDVTVTNVGGADAQIGLIDATQFAAPFALVADGCSLMTLTAGIACTLTIEFTPTEPGKFTIEYGIPSNDFDKPIVNASVSGNATEAPMPVITVSPPGLDFGDVPILGFSILSLQVENEGTADLEILGLQLAGDATEFLASTNNCVTLPPGAQCSISVAFVPMVVGNRSAVLTILSNAANGPALAVELNGTAVNEDTDGDGVLDVADNCTLVPNPAQRDTDSDGYGNHCDADLNNDCIVNVVDLGLLRTVFFSPGPDADFNGDGVVNILDLGILRNRFFGSPGPSGLAGGCEG